MAKAVAEEALGKDERIISVGSSYSDGENFAYRLISNGFEARGIHFLPILRLRGKERHVLLLTGMSRRFI